MSKTSTTAGKTHRHGGKHHRSRHDEQEAELFRQTLSIIVYRGDPVDAQSTRHVAWYIQYADGSNVLSHVTGGYGFFAHDERWNTNPSESRHYERTIPVSTIASRESRDLTVRNILFNVPVNNEERAWNCQTWIGDGFAALRNILPDAVATAAADQMTDVLLEAPEED
jgi:hypothetical protein